MKRFQSVADRGFQEEDRLGGCGLHGVQTKHLNVFLQLGMLHHEVHLGNGCGDDLKQTARGWKPAWLPR